MFLALAEQSECLLPEAMTHHNLSLECVLASATVKAFKGVCLEIDFISTADICVYCFYYYSAAEAGQKLWVTTEGENELPQRLVVSDTKNAFRYVIQIYYVTFQEFSQKAAVY